jgi:hypothetical protein
MVMTDEYLPFGQSNEGSAAEYIQKKAADYIFQDEHMLNLTKDIMNHQHPHIEYGRSGLAKVLSNACGVRIHIEDFFDSLNHLKELYPDINVPNDLPELRKQAVMYKNQNSFQYYSEAFDIDLNE